MEIRGGEKIRVRTVSAFREGLVFSRIPRPPADHPPVPSITADAVRYGSPAPGQDCKTKSAIAEAAPKGGWVFVPSYPHAIGTGRAGL